MPTRLEARSPRTPPTTPSTSSYASPPRKHHSNSPPAPRSPPPSAGSSAHRAPSSAAGRGPPASAAGPPHQRRLAVRHGGCAVLAPQRERERLLGATHLELVEVDAARGVVVHELKQALHASSKYAHAHAPLPSAPEGRLRGPRSLRTSSQSPPGGQAPDDGPLTTPSARERAELLRAHWD